MTTLWFVAGEASGDARAAELMRCAAFARAESAIRRRRRSQYAGLAAEPFDNWIAEAGVLGLWDVLKHYRYFRRKFFRMLERIEELRPAAVVLVDYPGFNVRLAKALRNRHSPARSSTISALKCGPGIAGASRKWRACLI